MTNVGSATVGGAVLPNLTVPVTPLQNLETTTILIGGKFDSTAPIGGSFIQGNIFKLQNLDTVIKVAGDMKSGAPIAGVFLQGNEGMTVDHIKAFFGNI